MIQVYTGNGKGKTTAAFGLALRAAGAGLNVYIAQFLKGRDCSEHKALKKIKNIKLEQFGRGCFIRCKYQQIDMKLTRQGLEKVKKVITSRNYHVVILDEINVVLKLKFLSFKDILSLIKCTPENIELVFTGRGAPAQLIKKADLVSQIREVKHYYKRGIKARKGIEF
ncbi:MAG: cob(I)yrinic acid a,c-diamide adenosyltransferase [Candidatus Omnitrophica bacterium]|nr:cob(I)yrinic acid a,c-diamide adenosyltransferase [Candidatus Omnitrophota bacterium]MBU1922753.1 cob(I)yrinic acid a,c-diamide adenosyltransferase [Candidatus Omnitrophota bacterium]